MNIPLNPIDPLPSSQPKDIGPPFCVRWLRSSS
jgi:hypothetical protein